MAAESTPMKRGLKHHILEGGEFRVTHAAESTPMKRGLKLGAEDRLALGVPLPQRAPR